MDYKFIIFDWDGTLMDSAGKIVKCMQLAAQDEKLPIPNREQVEHIIGISLAPAIGILFETQDEYLISNMVESYKHHFLNSDSVPCPLFPGAELLLKSLQKDGKTLAVATGKARRGLTRAWEQTDTRQFFTYSRCSDEAESKPSSDMLLQLLEESKYKISETVMIGDTTYDMQMAKAIGMDRIAVNYGVHHEEKLKENSPVFQANSIAELHQFLLKN
jgi:phosphoglycolate phosphatase